MQKVRLGRNGPEVSVLGLGCMGMSPGVYGTSDETESVATLRAAVEAGVTLIDTGDFYGMGHNEMLIRRALEGTPREGLVYSVKFGALRGPDGSWGGNDGRPQAVKNFLAYSLRRLGTDYIDVYRPARLDPAVPIEDTIGAIADLVRAGFVRHIGLSEVDAETIRRAAAVHPIVDLQIEYSLLERRLEGELLKTCRKYGVGVTAYGVLARGLLGGRLDTHLRTDDYRRFSARFQGENLRANLELGERLRASGRTWGAMPAQAAIAWALAQGEDIIPLVGARSRVRLNEAVAALDLKPTAADLRD